jgi:hypothetical protein
MIFQPLGRGASQPASFHRMVPCSMKITQDVCRYSEEHGLELQRHLVIDQSLLVLVVAGSCTSMVMTSGQLGHGAT